MPKWKLGQHGAKTQEQKRLSQKYNKPVAGDTHESEHIIGYDVLASSSGWDRKKGQGQKLEKEAPAYQEVKPLHRAHIGTGTIGKEAVKRKRAQGYDPYGFDSSEDYREAQRTALEKEKKPGNAYQLNQLGYAFNKDFSTVKRPRTEEEKAAKDSFRGMLDIDAVPYAKGQKQEQVSLTPKEKVEIDLARKVAEKRGKGKGGFPSLKQEMKSKSRFDPLIKRRRSFSLQSSPRIRSRSFSIGETFIQGIKKLI